MVVCAVDGLLQLIRLFEEPEEDVETVLIRIFRGDYLKYGLKREHTVL